MYGQMTAGSWIYIGSQGIVQGTYETFVEVGPPALRRRPLGQMDPHRRARRHGRRAAARRDDGGRLDARDRMPALAHRDAAAHRLCRRAGEGPRRGARHHRARRARRRKPFRSRFSATPPKSIPELVRRGVRPDVRHRPDLGARSDQRLSAGGLDARRMGGRARARSESGRAGREGNRWPCTCAPCSISSGRACRRSTTATTSARCALDMGVEGCVRLSRLRAGLYPSAVLPRHRAVPLGGALGRSRGHLQDRRQGEGADAATTSICITGSTWRAQRIQLPGPAGAHLLGRARRPASPRPCLQRDGGERAS